MDLGERGPVGAPCARIVRRHREPALVDADEARRIAVGAVDRARGSASRPRRGRPSSISVSSAARAAACVGQDLEHGAVARDRGLRVEQLDLDEVRGAEREVRTVLRVDREQRAPVDDIEQLGPHLLLRRRSDRARRARAARRRRHRGSRSAGRSPGRRRRAAARRRRAAAWRSVLARREVGGQLDLALERAHQLARIARRRGTAARARRARRGRCRRRRARS